MASKKTADLTRLDRVLLSVAPKWALGRIRARAAALTLTRHYEGAAAGRRTSGWNRSTGDANASNGPALSLLRASARDLMRNNPWARGGVRTVANNTVGWGIVPKPVGVPSDSKLAEAWKAWANSTQADADGRLTFYGIQRQAMETIAEAGEVLIRRRPRRAEDGLAIPIQLQVLEPDFIDTSKDLTTGPAGGPIIQGVEFDMVGRRVAYWLFPQHPGSFLAASSSRRVPASEILHVFRLERPGQVRGVSWLAPVLVRLREFDEYEDATLLRQKIAACFAAFVVDADGNPDGAIGEKSADDELVETIEPGLIEYLPPGKTIEFASPPVVTADGFSERTLRGIAKGLGTTYEDLTGDYSQVNFSSGRMGRLGHWANVHDWRWNMLVPQLCDPAWAWVMEAAVIAGLASEAPGATWTAPPMPMIEPDKEGLAITRLVRAGAMTHDQMVREQGEDPEQHWAEYGAGLKKLDELGIMLDSDARKTSAAGLTQERPGSGAGGGDAGGKGGG